MDRWQKTEDGGQKTEDREQKTEDRRQRTEDREQITDRVVISYWLFGEGHREAIADWEKHREWGKWN